MNTSISLQPIILGTVSTMAAHSYEIGLVMAAMENAGASSRSLLRPSSSKKPASQKFQSLDPEMQARDSTDSYESSMKGKSLALLHNPGMIRESRRYAD